MGKMLFGAISQTIFTVRRHAPELIRPAQPTPRELKPLSDIDDQEGLRFHIPLIYIYRQDPIMRNKNPASVIREALAKVLVFYYPFAGRLKEGPARKLMVDCSGDGVLFIEAEADVTLKQLGDALMPPFPCMNELLCDVPGSDGILDSPLLLIQVTRLLCGGFVFALRLNHTMSDAPGLVQFLTALGEMAQGASTPSTLPVWQRELLFAREPPRVTYAHREYDNIEDAKGTIIQQDDITHKSFFFGPTELSALRRLVPVELQSCTTFELLTACLWRCRTIALQPDPEDEMRIICLVNARYRFNPPAIPIGYYGNTFVMPCAISTARELCKKPLAHALELVRKVKSDVTEEYVRSNADLMVIKGRPLFTAVGSFIVSDVTRSGLNDVDFGWGKAVYGGVAKGGAGSFPGVSFFVAFTNHKGESGIVVPICLPSVAMEKFVEELNSMLVQDNNNHVLQAHKLLATSKL
ncbi:benzyl alcohol O-benzoyltransferase [Lactuca sativa]|uniref:Benzyl alcohol O-benzoyltransferase n=1 Tax=Lactuca sativa TaxID=4236 RepID=A0A9R1WIP6_LACSA|nr:benzyl alcohol O-benzoyltransferase [Lactuca sativa]KAJ0224713.1 hypothetical protein LSAT_V11C100022710 [Lactuca sativa]